MPRFHCPVPLQSGQALSLPPGAARHVQVLRLQPGDPLTLFNGAGGEFEAAVRQMGRHEVWVEVGAHRDCEREIGRAVTLAVAMPANDRMDWLVEKATELGVVAIQPLLTERVVLRLKDERAQKKQAHWQAVAAAACEQCGRNRLPEIAPVRAMAEWLAMLGPSAGMGAARLLLSLQDDSQPIGRAWPAHEGACLIAVGPEGGWTPAEERQLRQHAFLPVVLGPTTLRAETAALAALAKA